MHSALGKIHFVQTFMLLQRLIHTLQKLSLFLLCSQEEIESLREKLAAQSSLVVVGSSDDALNVKRLNRVMPGVTQSMIDNMIVVCMEKKFVNFACIINYIQTAQYREL